MNDPLNECSFFIPEDNIAGLAGVLSMAWPMKDREEVKEAIKDLILTQAKEYHEFYSNMRGMH